ncbi:MAG: OB-fold-containig protein [bacterium]
MDQALSPEFAPFTFALGLMVAILGVELLALMLGMSLHGGDGDLDLSTDLAALHANFDLAPDASPDVGTLLEISDSLDTAPEAAPDAGFLTILGLGRVPLMIWLASMLFSFGLAGLVIQGVVASIAAPLPALVAVPIALAAALGFSRAFSGAFARLIPSLETSATSTQFLGGLRGVVSQGTARAGSAAEVRLHDRHGNLHFLRCEPFHSADIIAEGTEVLTLRERLGPNQWRLKILRIS